MKCLREQIGYVMQEPILFDMSIKENILFGNPNATDEDIFKAAFRSNAVSFIETLKEVEIEENNEHIPIAFRGPPKTELKSETEKEKQESIERDIKNILANG